MDSTEVLIVIILIIVTILFAVLSGPPKPKGTATTSVLSSMQSTISSAVGNMQSSRTSSSTSTTTTTSSSSHIIDKYSKIEQVQEALKEAGLESCNLIVGIDYTKSNETSGRYSFQGRSLHTISASQQNPYQQVISILGRTLEVFDEDKQIPVYGFGDITTKGNKVFPFIPDRPCNGFEEALKRYNEITPQILLSGPTNFAPLIYEAINIVKAARDFHLLVIVADGLVTSEKETMAAIVEASKYPMSIVMVGVGDGPFDQMKEFDDNIPDRKFDNFQFVNYNEVMKASEHPDATFALNALMEVPEQFKLVKKMGLL